MVSPEGVRGRGKPSNQTAEAFAGMQIEGLKGEGAVGGDTKSHAPPRSQGRSTQGKGTPVKGLLKGSPFSKAFVHRINCSSEGKENDFRLIG